jgi:hypothetical protein
VAEDLLVNWLEGVAGIEVSPKQDGILGNYVVGPDGKLGLQLKALDLASIALGQLATEARDELPAKVVSNQLRLLVCEEVLQNLGEAAGCHTWVLRLIWVKDHRRLEHSPQIDD